MQAFPDISILIHRDHQASRRETGLGDGNRIARHLARLGIQFRNELVLEIGEPNIASLVEQRVMRRGALGKIISRDDGLR